MYKSLLLTDKVNYIKGIGPKKQDKLRNMGIETVQDLIEHFPVKYRDRRIIQNASSAPIDKDVLVSGRLVRSNIRSLSSKRSVIECHFRDETINFSAVFFNMPYLKQTLSVGEHYVIFGKMKIRNGLRIWTNPEIAKEGSKNDTRGLIPVYRCTAGITSRELIKWIKIALDETDIGYEWIDSEIIEKNKLCSREYSYRNIHFPESEQSYRAAKYRIIYEQLILYQLAIRINRRTIDDGTKDSSISNVSIKPFIESLPFVLTNDQKKCIQEIEKDLSRPKPMNRLVQGDVGCGKTVVAEAAIYICTKAGNQAALMAPTAILAKQHFERLSRDFKNLGIRTALLISGMKTSERRELLKGVKSGQIDLVIGTHAILTEDVEFKNLALAITDEQHRFGVNQRKKLTEKGRGINILVMSATPIPRTLAATVFGDMDFSIIKLKPEGRLETITRAVTEESRERAYTAIKKELVKGCRAYVIAPSIEDNEDELSSVEKLYNELKRKFSNYNIACLHGKMSKEDKEYIMNDFAKGKADILVATVVVEVGIDISDATIIVIENAERFGLAQLHQLRGRVGRSDMQSYCYLVNYSKSESAKIRTEAMVNISDGFAISEEDYRLRGPGDLAGTMQSGNYQSDIMSLCRYTDILDLAVKDADYIMEENTVTDINFIREYMETMYKNDNSDII